MKILEVHADWLALADFLHNWKTNFYGMMLPDQGLQTAQLVTQWPITFKWNCGGGICALQPAEGAGREVQLIAVPYVDSFTHSSSLCSLFSHCFLYPAFSVFLGYGQYSFPMGFCEQCTGHLSRVCLVKSNIRYVQTRVGRSLYPHTPTDLWCQLALASDQSKWWAVQTKTNLHDSKS